MNELPARKGLSFERLRSFLLLAEAGGIAAAVRGDPVRQSLLSRQVRELEAYFGVALTERRGRGLALTAAGEHLAQVVRESVRGLGDVATLGTLVEPTWTLGAGDSLLQWWVLPRVAAWVATTGRVRLSVKAHSTADVVAGLLDARLDVGVLRAVTAPRGLHARALGRPGWALFVPRALHARGASLAQVVATVPLALQQGEPGLDAQLWKSAQAEGPVRAALWCETFPQVRSAVETGQFAGLLPTLGRATLPRDAYVELPLPKVGARGERLWLAWHARTLRTRLGAERVLGALEERLRLG